MRLLLVPSAESNFTGNNKVAICDLNDEFNDES